ncbi:hypothetical protein ABZ318_14810 [Streptomyces sp. NPDC006197]|uniref:PGAP1-like alpha/beta domain-containing protein n=1 Tax=Streptomyces sp. NPDC006197 TaxID=3156685 RepID=UPI0033B3C1F1
MAVFVGVHGIGQQYRGGFELASMWFDSLRDGLVAAGHDSEASALTSEDVRVAFFGDLFRPSDDAMSGGMPPYTADDIPDSGLELELLKAFHSAALEQSPHLAAQAGAMSLRGTTKQLILSRLAQSPTFVNVAQRLLIGNVKQVSRFLTEEDLKETVLKRLDQQVGEDTRALIGHSLGSVVAYEYLCKYQPTQVRTFVTVGSPLGIPNLIFDRLTPRPASGVGTWPRHVTRWANIADKDDIVALRKDLAGLFTGPSGAVVEDGLVDNGGEPHAIRPYLNARLTGGVLHGALE